MFGSSVISQHSQSEKGNVIHAKQSPFFNSGIQPKLAINQPNDVYEQEADAMADHVMRMPDASLNINSFFKPAITSVQRKCAHCEEEEKKIQRKEMNNGETVAGVTTENYISSLSGKGRSLSNEEKKFFEPRMGYDFSDVRLHSDVQANESAKDINAKAYTHGNNIVFGSDQYQLFTESGKKLMAHELTHVVQQKEMPHSKNIQRLTVTPKGNISTGQCGQYEKFWIFGLSSPAPEDGYIIQQVDLYEDIKSCPLTAVDLANPTLTFWEAWCLQKGEKRQHIHNTVGFTDRAALDAHPNQSGSHAAVGTIKFFKKSVTGDLGKENVISSDPSVTWKQLTD